jgi:signal peptidase II
MAEALRKDGVSRNRFWGALTPLGLSIAVLVFCLDQAVKAWLLYGINMPARKIINIAPFFDITMAWNFGVSYGLMTTHLQGLLVLISVLVSALLWIWLARSARPLNAASLGLVIGGALSNALDRLVHGAVADFFYFHYRDLKLPFLDFVFNPADVAIVAGVALLLYESFMEREVA